MRCPLIPKFLRIKKLFARFVRFVVTPPHTKKAKSTFVGSAFLNFTSTTLHLTYYPRTHTTCIRGQRWRLWADVLIVSVEVVNFKKPELSASRLNHMVCIAMRSKLTLTCVTASHIHFATAKLQLYNEICNGCTAKNFIFPQKVAQFHQK